MNERNFWAILSHDPRAMGHEFVQADDDVRNGCARCWATIERGGDASD